MPLPARRAISMSSALTCPECAARFAVDQRYCTECGHRVRPLPRSVAMTLAAMAAPRRAGADRLNPTPAGAGGATSSSGDGPRLTLFGQPVELPSPRVLAVAVMAVLAFGVIVGTGSFSLASSPLRVTVNRPATRPAAAATTTPPALSSSSPTPAPATSSASSPSPSASSPGPASSASTPAASVPANSNSSSSSSSSTTTASSSTSSDGLPPIKHVWVIELGDQGYAQTFENTSSDTYLNKTLASQGEVVPNVYSSATSDLANELALVSGQGPTVQTEDDCPTYSAISPGTLGSDDQVIGDGCVYPATTPSFESELTAAGDSWKAYVQGQGTLASSSCITPTLGSADPHFTPSSTTGYETWRNPFIYLGDVIDSGSCAYDDTGLTELKSNLANAAATPDVSFIYPNSCDDGSDTPCRPGAPSGTKESDKFLQSVVPEIMASPAYKADGMILITFAQAPQSGAGADQSSCCDQPTQYPNLPGPNYVPPASGTSTSTTGTTTPPVATTTTASAPDTGTSTVPGIGDPGLTTGPIGTTTTPGGVTTGDTTDTTPATATCATTTTGTDTTVATTTAADTTTAATTAATGTDTTPSTGCCPTTTPTGTETTAAPTTTTDTTTTDTGTDTTAATPCCPTTTSAQTAGPDTGTTPTGTDTTPTGTDATGTAATTTTPAATTTATGTTTTPATQTAACPSPGPDSTETYGGGGQTGMLVLSRYVSPNLQDGTDYFNTFSITASLEQLFGLKYTGYADINGLPLFSGFFYSNPSG